RPPSLSRYRSRRARPEASDAHMPVGVRVKGRGIGRYPTSTRWLLDLGGWMDSGARYGSERHPTAAEEGLRAGFGRDSVHSLNTADSRLLHRLFPVAMWYKTGAGLGSQRRHGSRQDSA